MELSDQLSRTADEAISDGANQIYISAASVWELTLKESLGKLTTSGPVVGILDRLLGSGAKVIPITMNHALATAVLPWHHRDPFDRILLAQAMYEKLTIVTRDRFFHLYDVPLLL